LAEGKLATVGNGRGALLQWEKIKLNEKGAAKEEGRGAFWMVGERRKNCGGSAKKGGDSENAWRSMFKGKGSFAMEVWEKGGG